MESENLTKKVTQVITDFRNYIEARYKYTRLNTVEKFVVLASSLITVLVVLIFISIILLFLSVALAFYFAKIWDNKFYGFAMVSGIYFVIGFFVYIFRKYIIVRPVQEYMLTTIFKNDEETKKQ